MKTLRTLLILAATAILLAPAARASDLVPAPGRGMFSVPVRTYADIRFEDIVKQKYDISCGAAALATLLKYYYELDIGEQEVIDGILAGSSEETRSNIAKYGFSMLELKRAGEEKGFVAAGFRLDDAATLRKLDVPALTLINIRGYNHFVVIKGVKDGQVLIADPAFGNRVRPIGSFEKEWSSIVLVLVHPERQGDSAFVTGSTLRAHTREIIPMLDRGLRTVVAPPANEF